MKRSVYLSMVKLAIVIVGGRWNQGGVPMGL